tara:strand:- start:1126 stop:1782 length:657 start_codon:yes stop_codon:yes gene_type:complete
MSIARDISRQSSKQNATLTADQTAVTVTGGFSGSSIQVYLNGVKIIQGQDYSLNGTSGITLTQGASAGDIIEFVIRNTSNSGFSAANTGQIVDQAVTFDKLSNSGTEGDNARLRVAKVFGSVDLNAGVGGIAAKLGTNLNVSSITDGNTGTCTVNFDTPMSDANYTVVCSPREIDGVTNTWTAVTRSHTTSSFYLVATKYNNAVADIQVSFVVFGELS